MIMKVFYLIPIFLMISLLFLASPVQSAPTDAKTIQYVLPTATKLESIIAKLRSVEEDITSVAAFYKSKGNEEKAGKLTEATKQIQIIIKRIQSVESTLSENLNNLRGVIQQVKKDIDDILNSIKELINTIDNLQLQPARQPQPTATVERQRVQR